METPGIAPILVSHYLCPYVQRAAIALAEKAVAFERVYIDLSNKPDWFKAISPLGKVPLLRVRARGGEESVLFESVAILEYLEDTQPNPLHPADPLVRARHRAWIEYGSSVLNDIGAFYSAADEAALISKAQRLGEKFARVETELGEGPWFANERFTLVDAVFGPIFRYFDVFDEIADFGIFNGKPKTKQWRAELSRHPSIYTAVSPDYSDRLRTFTAARNSYLSSLLGISD
jgi:glutathione S-transferase